MSSGCCLQKISLLLKNDVIEPVIAFVSQHILDPLWKNRYAALIALGAIAEGPEKLAFAQILEHSIGNLINMYSDTSLKVREAISWVINQICEHHAEVLVSSPELTSHFVTVLISSIKDFPRVSIQSCTAIEKLAESLTPIDQATPANQLTPHFTAIAQALIENSERTDCEGTQFNLVLASYQGLISLTQHCCLNSHPALFQMLLPICNMLEQTISNPVGDSKRVKDQQDMLCGMIQVIMAKVGSEVDDITGEKIVKLLIMMFQSVQKVTESGLLAY